MVAYLQYTMFLLAAASSSLAAPTVNDRIENNTAAIIFQEGKSGSPRHQTIYIGPKTDPSSPRYAEVDVSPDQPLYNLEVTDGPSDIYCYFRLQSSNLPSWIPGQSDRVTAEETLTANNFLTGPIENVKTIVCQTEVEYVP